MPIGYLVTAILLAWCTLCAVAPRRAGSQIGWLSFTFGFAINEQPSVGLLLAHRSDGAGVLSG